jgi:integrase
MYYAALRPSEALALHAGDIVPPAKDGEWGWIRVSRSNTTVGNRWTDTGKRGPRQLKHRAAGAVRVALCPPELVALLCEHERRYGLAADGRLFRGGQDGHIRDEDYLSVWHAARRLISGDVIAQRAVARPYDLRHSAVSTWLAAGVDPTQIAAWAGHSVAVLLRVYAHALASRVTSPLNRIDAALAVRDNVAGAWPTEP